MEVLITAVCVMAGTFIGRWLATRSRRKYHEKHNKNGGV